MILECLVDTFSELQTKVFVDTFEVLRDINSQRCSLVLRSPYITNNLIYDILRGLMSKLFLK